MNFRTRIQSGLLSSTLALALIATGCNLRNSQSVQKSGGDVMATVNGYKILNSEVDQAYSAQTASTPQKPGPWEERELRLNIVHQLIETRLQLQRAEKLGIAATHDEVESKFNQAKAPYTQEQFEKQLKDSGLTEDGVREEIRRNLTVEKLANKEITSKVDITDADVQSYYDQNRAQFNLTEPRYNLAHIFVTDQGGPQSAGIPDKAQNEADALKKIQAAHSRLDSGEDFGSVASHYSEDPATRNSGGDLGVTSDTQLKSTDAATRDAVLRLKPGQYSDPIAVINPQTHQHLGYRIIKEVATEAVGQRGLSDPAVQQFIRNQLSTQREQFLRAVYEEVLHNGAEIHDYYAEQVLKEEGQK